MQQLKQLKRDHSLKITKGMLVQWDDREVELDPAKIIRTLEGKRAFATGGKVIAFVSDGELFVTPYTQESLNTLRSNDYKEFAFFVPFSPQGMVPKDPELASLWQDLMHGISFASRSMQDRRAELARGQARSTNDLQVRWTQSAVATA